jgi:predicted SAM-dependent methyltransferase
MAAGNPCAPGSQQADDHRQPGPRQGGTLGWQIDASPFRLRVKTVATALIRPFSSVRARAISRRDTPLRLHVGCGPTRLPGWVNVDLAGRLRVDLALDVRKRLPFPDGAIEAVFTEHLLEHLRYQEAELFVSETARVLRPGGIVRIVTPDFGRYARAYADGGALLSELRPGRVTHLMALAEVAHGHGHRSVWDEETLCTLLEAHGIDARPRACGESALDDCPDNPLRSPESLYIEGVKR